MSSFPLDNFREILKNTECFLENKDSISDNSDNTTTSKTLSESESKSEDKNSIIKNENINIFSLKEKLTVFPKEIITNETRKSRRVIAEFCIPIFNYWRSNKNCTYLFRNFYHMKINVKIVVKKILYIGKKMIILMVIKYIEK